MAPEDGTWIMHGRQWDDPLCVHTWQELVERIDEVGFLPLFRNEVEGLSAEELTSPLGWWSADPENDPWIWREVIARSHLVAYGKFFGGKAGFVSLRWFPAFANLRRDGYDFDARWDDGLARRRSKKLMDCFAKRQPWVGPELREQAGFGRGGEKNFSGMLTELQMQTYLTICDFRRKVDRHGKGYGMPMAVYGTPEALWGAEVACGAYGEPPEASCERICAHLSARFPHATPGQLQRLLR